MLLFNDNVQKAYVNSSVKIAILFYHNFDG